VSYGYDLIDNYRRAAIYADRILRGTKPSELPVQLFGGRYLFAGLSSTPRRG